MNRIGRILAGVVLTGVLGLTVPERQVHAWGPELHPEFNGLRLKGSGPEQYLVDRGCRRHIPDIATRNRLFRDQDYQTFDIQQISECKPISTNAMLVKGENRQEIFLLDAGVKRWVTSQAVMDRYRFNYNNVQRVSPPELLDYVPSGGNIF